MTRKNQWRSTSSSAARGALTPGVPIRMNNAAKLDELVVLMRLHTGLEGLASGIGQNDPDDDAYPATDAEHASHLRKMLGSLAVRLFGDKTVRIGGSRWTRLLRLNIERFCKILTGETNQIRRRTLLHLIAEEKVKLDRLIGALSS